MNKIIRLFTNNWFLKLVSLILAIVLFLSLREETTQSSKNDSRRKSGANTINRSYATVTNTILKALHTTEEPPQTQPQKNAKKVPGQKNAK